MNKEKVLIVGLGSMGKRRLRHLINLSLGYEIIGCDSNIERCKQVEREFGIVTYTNLTDNLLVQSSFVFIATSPINHADIINKALLFDCHIFTELNLISKRYDENIRLAKDKNKTLFLSSTSLYKKELIFLTDKIKVTNEPLNYIYHFGQYLPDWHPWENYNDFFVGNKLTNGCREIMAIEFPWLINAFGNIKNIKAFSSKNTSLKIDYPDNYLLYIEHENGNKGCFALDVVSRKPTKKLEVYGENLHLTWNGTPDSLLVYDFEKKEDLKVFSEYSNHQKNYAAHVVEDAYRDEIVEFFEVVLQNKKPKYSFEKDLEILNLIDRIEGLTK
ncbi:MAG: Gfo/Idh/MocA family oxidoreductase [Paludibacter sp.]|nr:Gfo/Idh/MocA family oxidoreductase [Paludibacter sp.]